MDRMCATIRVCGMYTAHSGHLTPRKSATQATRDNITDMYSSAIQGRLWENKHTSWIGKQVGRRELKIRKDSNRRGLEGYFRRHPVSKSPRNCMFVCRTPSPLLIPSGDWMKQAIGEIH